MKFLIYALSHERFALYDANRFLCMDQDGHFTLEEPNIRKAWDLKDGDLDRIYYEQVKRYSIRNNLEKDL